MPNDSPSNHVPTDRDFDDVAFAVAELSLRIANLVYLATVGMHALVKDPAPREPIRTK